MRNLWLRIHALFINLAIVGLLMAGCSSGQEARSTPTATSSNESDFSGKETIEEVLTKTQAATQETDIFDVKTYSVLLIGVDEQPFTAITSSIQSSVEDAINSINGNKEALGFEINYFYIATDKDPESIGQKFSEGIRKHRPLLVLMAAPIDDELQKEISRLRVPVLYFGLGASSILAEQPGDDYIFWLTPPPDVQFAFFLDQTWKNWEEMRPPGNMNEFKIGYLTWEEPPNKLALTPRLSDFYEQNRFGFIFEGSQANSANASVTNYLLQCITFGITVIYTDTFGYGPMVLLNDLYSLGLNDFFVVGGSVWSYEAGNTQYLLNPESAETIYLSLPVRWWTEESHPAIIRANQIFIDAERSAKEKNFAYLLGLGAVDIAFHVIHEVHNKEMDLSPSRVFTELNELDEYLVLDGLFEINYSQGNQSPKNLRLWSINPGQGWVPVSEFELVPNLVADEEN